MIPCQLCNYRPLTVARSTHLRLWYALQPRRRIDEQHVTARHAAPVVLAAVAEQHAEREANIKWLRVLNLVDLLLHQLDSKSLDIALQVIDLAAANDGVDLQQGVKRSAHAPADHDDYRDYVRMAPYASHTREQC